MVEIPTMKDEDGKRPNRGHDSLIGERSRIVKGLSASRSEVVENAAVAVVTLAPVAAPTQRWYG
jgi:hypothetical protein